jgi:poly(hydroxyalkanoate) depolymerase family esterase
MARGRSSTYGLMLGIHRKGRSVSMRFVNGRNRGVAIACAVVAAGAASSPAGAVAAPAGGTLVTRSYTNAAGTRSYEVYVPASYQPGAPVPLVVALHGCTQTADGFRSLTRLDDLAAARGFIVVFPEQPKSANSFGCWNWFNANQLQRGSPEPSLIAGVTDEVRGTYAIDPKRIYVTGLSAGGAMASVMGATYPDLYAAIGVGSGCEYAAGAPCAGYRSADPQQAGRQAYQAMGSRARVVPFIVFEGDKDTTVPPVNADQLVQAGQVTADWADDGAQNGSIPTAAARSSFGQASARSYTLRRYKDGRGQELSQYWLVQGMGHAWSGGNPAESYADAGGPDESAAMYDFFMAHPGPGAPDLPPPPPPPAPPAAAAAPPAAAPPAAARPAHKKSTGHRSRRHRRHHTSRRRHKASGHKRRHKARAPR